MLREAKVVVPEFDNYHQSLDWVRGQVALLLQQAFGGVTITKAEGRWLDPATSKIYVEPVFLFFVACQDDAKTFQVLRKVASFIISAARQEAVYVTFPNGNVEIISKS